MRTSAFDFTVLNLPTALIRQGSAPARASIDPLEGRNLSGTIGRDSLPARGQGRL